ncbi:MAG: response regulator [Deltaproteobacteria bacterium]|nr:response regulator [Deltaproteobacteria bacterium]
MGRPFEILILDDESIVGQRLKPDLDGLQVLAGIRQKSPRTKVIMITGVATLELAHESLNQGAFDFIAKPFRIGKIRDTILKAVKTLEKEQGES